MDNSFGFGFPPPPDPFGLLPSGPTRAEVVSASLRGETPKPQAVRTVSTSVTPVKRVEGHSFGDPIDAHLSRLYSEREKLDSAYDKMLEIPDYSKMQEYAKERSGKGSHALLLAMASQLAGEDMKPLGAMYLKQASEARNPLKVASGYIDENGEYIEDPDARREIEGKRLEGRVKSLDTTIARLIEKQSQNQNARELKQMGAAIAASVAGARSGGDFGGNHSIAGTDEAGNPVFINKQGRLFKYGADGNPVFHQGPLGAKPKPDKDPTGEERSAAGYLGRMEAAEVNLANAKPYPIGLQFGLDKAPNLTNFALSGPQQVQRQQQEDWVRAKLRKESGAVIGDEEMAREIRTYFPMAGDGPAVIAQKAQSRAQAIEQMRSAAGKAKSKIADPVNDYAQNQRQGGMPDYGTPPEGSVVPKGAVRERN